MGENRYKDNARHSISKVARWVKWRFADVLSLPFCFLHQALLVTDCFGDDAEIGVSCQLLRCDAESKILDFEFKFLIFEIERTFLKLNLRFLKLNVPFRG